MEHRIEVVKQAFQNYFKISEGMVWTNPLLDNVLEALHSETANTWVVQKTITNKLLIDLKKHFRGVEIVSNTLLFTRKERELTISLTVVIIGSDQEVELIAINEIKEI